MTKVRPTAKEQPRLVGELPPFNLVQLGSRFLGVPRSLGDIDLASVAIKSYPEILSARSRDELEQLIETHAAIELARWSSIPRLLESRDGYNVVCFRSMYLAIPHGLGDIDLQFVDSAELVDGSRGVLFAPSREGLERLIATEAKADPELSWSIPCLVETRGGYNIVSYRGMHIAIPLDAGDVDLRRVDPKEIAGAIVKPSLAAVSEEIARTGGRRSGAAAPQLKYRGSSGVPLTDLGVPEVVEIEPTHTCNLRCIQCHVSYELLTKQLIRPDFLKNMKGLEGCWTTVGSMYEPAAHPKFAEIMLGLTELGLKIDLTTNGTLMADRVVQRLAQCRLANVTVSFDGMRKETFERIRRRAAYEMTLARIRALREGITDPRVYFNLNYTVMRSNLDEIAEAVDYWEAARFDHLGLILMVLRDDNATLKAENPHPIMDLVRTKLDSVAKQVLESNYRLVVSCPAFLQSPLRSQFPGQFCGDVVRSSNAEALLPYNPRTYYQNGPYPGMAVDCRSPFKFARILYNGDVQLCYQFTVGNIYEESFLDIWYGRRARQVREAVLRSAKICHDCDYYRFCIKAGEIDLRQPENFINIESMSRANGVRFREPAKCEEYGPFNIIGWKNTYYAVYKPLGLVDVRLGHRDGILTADSIDDLKQKITQWIYTTPYLQPMTVEEFPNYRLMGWLGKYYGIPKARGEINFGQDNLASLITCTDIGEARRLVMEADLLASSQGRTPVEYAGPSVPQPMQAFDAGEYNVITWRGRFYGLPKKLGPLDVSRSDISNLPGVVISESASALRARIGGYPLPTLLEDLGRYNLVAWQQTYYGVPKTLGPVDLIATADRKIRGLVAARSADEVKRLIGRTMPSRVHRWAARNPRLANYLRRVKAVIRKRSAERVSP